MIIAGIDPSINGSGIVKFELDAELNIVNKYYLTFTTVKKHAHKNSEGEIIFWSNTKNNSFRNDCDKYIYMRENIMKFIVDCEYVAFENYAFGAKGQVFKIGEFVGMIVQRCYETGKKIRKYTPSEIKMFFTGNGGAKGKELMVKYFLKHDKKDRFDLDKNNRLDKSPFADIVDGFAIAELLLTELKLRNNIITYDDLDVDEYRTFIKQQKKNKAIDILDRDFTYKGSI